MRGTAVTEAGEPTTARRPSTGVVLALVAAVAFTFGTGGFAVGTRRDTPSTADVGFLRDMIVHHEQAVEMSKIVIGSNLPAGAQSFVVEVISDQRYEIGLMETTLRRWKVPTETADGEAMAWMGDPVDAAAMPGMASKADLDALADATGDGAAEKWFQLMSVHHEGGLMMAEAAAQKVDDADVRALATRIARNQRIEINEYASAAKRLGVAVPAVSISTNDGAPMEHGAHP